MDPLRTTAIPDLAQLPKALDKQFVFVIGAPRSGTTWLVRMLTEHRSVASIPKELTIFSRYMAPWVEQYEMELAHHEQGKWSMGMPMLFDRQQFDALLRDLLDRFYGKVLGTNPAATHIVDKHPYYSQHLPVIDRSLPEAKFIHIIRDGREVAVSMMSASRRIGFGAREIKGAATNWFQCVTQARRYGAQLGPQRYMEIRYEALRKDPVKELERVFAFCGLELEGGEVERLADEYHISRKQVSSGDASLNALRDKPGAIWKKKLDLEQRYLFDRYAGHLLRELGYANGNWWAFKAGDRLKMTFHPIRQRLRKTVHALLQIWFSPVIKRLN